MNKDRILLTPECVCTEIEEGTEEELMEQMTYLLGNSGHVTDHDRLFKDIQLRESRGSTQIKDGLWVPHAQSTGVSSMCAAAGIVEHSQIFIMISWPENTAQCLKRLASLMDILQSDKLLRRMRDAQDAHSLYTLLKDHLTESGIPC